MRSFLLRNLMIISCPNCSRKYSVEDSKLVPNKKLRCVACGTVWEYVPESEENDDEGIIENLNANMNDEDTAQVSDDSNAIEDTEDHSGNEDRAENSIKENQEEDEPEQLKVVKKVQNKTTVNKNTKKTSVCSRIIVLLVLLIFVAFGWYFKDYALYKFRTVYKDNLLGKIIDVIAADSLLPKIENLSTEIKGDELLINGEIVNLSNRRTEYKFLKIRLIPDFENFGNVLMNDPLKCLSFTDDNYVKLSKTVLEPNERVNFSTKVELNGVKSALLKMEFSNLK